MVKGQMTEGSHSVCDQLTHNSDWLMVSEKGGVTRVKSLGSRRPGAKCSRSSSS